MNPFSSYFHDLRRRYRVSQKELANLIGYEQGYISGLEIGRKGPPNEEFIAKLIAGLNLDTKEEALLREAVKASKRKYMLPGDASAEIFMLMHELWHELDKLHPAQIRMIRDVLHFREQLGSSSRTETGRIPYRDQRQEAQM